MNEIFLLLAESSPRTEELLLKFKWSMTLAGIGVMMIGVALAVWNIKNLERTKAEPIRWLPVIMADLVGMAIIAYAWVGL
jgi:hypothetical protein